MSRRVLTAVVAGAIAAACSDSVRPPTQPETFSVPLVVAQHDGTAHNHRAHLSGRDEVFVPPAGSPADAPTPADSNAQGQAIIQIAEDQGSFDFKLIASNIENIVQAHIHCGPAGVNGPIIVWLYPSVTATAALTGPTGRHDGVLAEGTVVSGATLHVRPVGSSAACPGGVATFADVLAKIRAANTYVNVHTNDGVAPTNTGPGDFPGGEVRGQVK